MVNRNLRAVIAKANLRIAKLLGVVLKRRKRAALVRKPVSCQHWSDPDDRTKCARLCRIHNVAGEMRSPHRERTASNYFEDREAIQQQTHFLRVQSCG